MKLLYIGTHFCPAETLSRLLLLGTELCFLDRPSVTFDNWGTIGQDSYMRRLSFGEAPVKLSVHKPPSGPAVALYKPYIEADIADRDFVRAVLEGLRIDDVFAERLLAPQAIYGNGHTGRDVRRLLIRDPSLIDASYDLVRDDQKFMYQPDTVEGRRATARTLLVEASIQITAALLMADELNALPVGDDHTYAKLLSLRTSSPRYIGGTPSIAPFLGLEFARAAIPDEALRKFEFSDIFAYREKTKDLYEAWNGELVRVCAQIAEADLANPRDTVEKLIVTDLAPKIREYENDMAHIRDNLFGSVIKSVTAWEMPTLSLSYIADLGYAGAAAAFAAGVRATVPHLVDYFNARRAAKRHHAISYLVGLTRR